MKKLKAKNAIFDSLSISGESQIEDLNVDTLELREIAAELSDTAVDVFVYDTRKDSDGGAWRGRTQNTSWYNEELNTAIRGGRREFPAVAVIVAEANKVTIYDGDDPDLPMWMVFNADVAAKLLNTIGGNTSLAALNGDIFVGCSEDVYGGVSIKIAFISDTSFAYAHNQISQWPIGISGRDSTENYTILVHSYGLVNLYVNDVAMTVLPNAPIDDNTGLPIPTIAVACGSSGSGGFSIINHDGTVVNKSYTESATNQSVSFTSDNRLVVSQKRNSNGDIWVAIYDNLTTSTNTTGALVHDVSISVKYNAVNWLRLPNILGGTTGTIGNKYIMSDSGLTLFDEDKSYIGSYVDGNPVNIQGMAAYTTSTYNTGWMPGDIKLATLSDTKTETVGVDETKLIDEQFATDVAEADFEETYSEWGTWLGTCSVVSNQLRVIVSGSSGAAGATTNFETVIGERYAVSFDYELGSADFLGFWIDDNNATGQADIYNDSNITSGSTRSVEFTATSTTTYLVFLAYGTISSNDYGVFDNISVKKTGELIKNGTFDNGTEGWDSYNNAILTYESSDYIKVARGNIYCAATQSFSTIPGREYIVSATLINSDFATQSYLEVTTNPAQNGHAQYAETIGETIVITYTASSTTSYIKLAVGVTASYSTWDNVSVRLAESDRSANNNGLQIFGEIDKTPVATGANLVAYSGFSTNNYLVQPYNSDLNGLNSFSIMGWVKRNGTITTEQPFVSFKDTSDDGVYSDGDTFMLFGTTPNHQLFFQTFEQSTSTDASQILWSGETIGEDIWANFCLVYDDSTSTTKIFINGKMVSSTTKNTGPVYLSNSVMTIGCRFKPTITGHVCDQVDLSIIRVSATIPTDAQIAKIYRDEKVLFQDGAQATLYGTSDAVTALAYDDKTELLHVGTSSGRSDFAGLRRINNTTTAVTTSISASNNLIAEQ